MADTSAFATPTARGLRGIVGTLRVVVAIQCWGAAGLRLLNPGGSPLARMFEIGRGLDAEFLTRVDQGVAVALLAAGVLCITRPCFPVLLPVVFLFVGDPVAAYGWDEGWRLHVSAAEAAGRMIAPLALMLLDWYPPKARFSIARFQISLSLVRVAAAVTFMAHGLAALDQSRNPGHYNELIASFSTTFHLPELSTAGAGWVLSLIGALDIAVGMNCLLTRSRAVAGWMILWGFVTAGSRVFHFGPPGVLEMMFRAAHAGLPLVLLVYWSFSVEEREHVVRPRLKKEG